MMNLIIQIFGQTLSFVLCTREKTIMQRQKKIIGSMMYHCCDFNIVLYYNNDGYTNKRSEVMAKKKETFLTNTCH